MSQLRAGHVLDQGWDAEIHGLLLFSQDLIVVSGFLKFCQLLMAMKHCLRLQPDTRSFRSCPPKDPHKNQKTNCNRWVGEGHWCIGRLYFAMRWGVSCVALCEPSPPKKISPHLGGPGGPGPSPRWQWVRTRSPFQPGRLTMSTSLFCSFSVVNQGSQLFRPLRSRQGLYRGDPRWGGSCDRAHAWKHRNGVRRAQEWAALLRSANNVNLKPALSFIVQVALLFFAQDLSGRIEYRCTNQLRPSGAFLHFFAKTTRKPLGAALMASKQAFDWGFALPGSGAVFVAKTVPFLLPPTG